MATRSRSRAARSNIRTAARSARRKRTIAHLPPETRRALGREAAKARTARAG